MPAGRGIARGVFVLGLLGLLLAGCNSMPRHRRAVTYITPPVAEAYPLVERPTRLGLIGAADQTPVGTMTRTKPHHVLAVCAGGVDCAFAAGTMVGWTQAGGRPTFDVATGTSSGALVAAFTFLGPKYDDKLQTLFTDISTKDMFRVRPVRYMIRDRALASPKPFEKRMEVEFGDAFFADLREAYAQGRRLFIGTTNIETKRLVVWDVGAIASSGRPDAEALVRKIMLATITWPALLPPVEFTVHENGQCRREQHIDGGATAQCFVRFGPTDGWPGTDESAPGWLKGSSLYVIAGGKLYDAPTPPSQKFAGRILNGTSCLINSLARADMNRLHTQCMSSGMRYHLLSLPDDYQGSQQTILKMEPAEMHRLFDAGYRLTCGGPRWRTTPPGTEPGEEEVPRGALIGAVCR